MANRTARWIATGVIAGGVFFILTCGGIGTAIYFMIGGQAEGDREILESDTTFSGHFGKIESFTYNYAASASHGAEADVYDAKGTKNSGRVTVKHDEAHELVWARFALASGEMVEIHPHARVLMDDAAATPTQGARKKE